VKDTWNVKSILEDNHLRLTMLSLVDEVGLADGQPPQKSYTYVLASRKGEDLESQFVSVLGGQL